MVAFVSKFLLKTQRRLISRILKANKNIKIIESSSNFDKIHLKKILHNISLSMFPI